MVINAGRQGLDVSEILQQVQDRLFGAEDTVCLERAHLVTEADRLFVDGPAPIRRARTLAHVLRHMSLDLDSNPILAGNTSSAPRAWMLVPEFALHVNAQVQIENDEFDAKWLDGKIPQDIIDYWKPKEAGATPGGAAGIGHMSLDFDTVVNVGLQGVLDRLRCYEGDSDPGRWAYREAMRIACQAVIEWAGRYAAAADARAGTESDPVLAECHRRMARACAHVPALPSRDYFEALQALLLVHLASVLEGQGMSQSIGLPDRAMRRFAPEVQEDPEAAVQLTSAFLLGVAANSFQGRGANTQAVTIGGADSAGRDRCNAVTFCFLDAFARTPVADPHLFLRWHDGLDGGAWERALEMLSRGRSMPLLINDHMAAPGLQDAGLSPEDAWDYCIAGCNEIAVPGRCTVTAWVGGAGGTLIDVKIIHDCMEQAADSISSVENILPAYEDTVVASVRRGHAARQDRIRDLVARVPFPFCSALCHGCIEDGGDYLEAMPYRDIQTVYARGMTNAINALAAIDDLVFTRGAYTVREILDGLAVEDAALMDALRAAPKWGNDHDRVDELAVQLHEARLRGLTRAAGDGGPRAAIVCHVIRSLHHLSGRALPATADGRGSGQPLSDSLGAEGGTAQEGPTAMLNSILKLDARRHYQGVYNLNVTLSTNQAAPGVLSALCEAFFHDGGQELQISVLDAEQLRAAKVHPERFRDLIVRIAGLNARFVELSELEQDEMIRRAEALA